MNSATLATRLLAWSKERFPFVNVISGLLLYFFAAAIMRMEAEPAVSWSSTDLLFGFAVAAHLLVLRVLDEHKDFEDDLVAHPNRVLQSGIVSLSELKVLGGIAASVTLLATIFSGSVEAFQAWACLMVWTTLMYYEMFCATWLKRHLFLYSLTHLFVVPLMMVWASALSSSEAFHSPQLPWIAGIAFTNAFIFEFLRKTKGRDEEISNVESFSGNWGIRGAVLAALFAHAVSFLILVVFAEQFLKAPVLSYLPTALAFLLSGVCLLKYVKNPVSQQRKTNEGAGALFSLIVYFTLIYLAIK